MNECIRPANAEVLDEGTASAIKKENAEKDSLSHLLPKDVREDLTVYVDTDIPVYKTASIADGACYNYRGKYYKYKREAVDACNSEGGDLGLIKKEYKPWSEKEAAALLDKTISSHAKLLPDAEFVYCLSSPVNFRYDIFPEYKSSRKGKHKPKHRTFLTDRIKDKHSGVIFTGYEADDVVGILQCTCRSIKKSSSIICTTDKDLLCIPGLHWNPDKGTITDVSELEAFRNFAAQVLQGDSTDSIPGLKGVGAKTSKKAVAGCDSTESMWGVVQKMYKDKGETEEYLHQMASMVWIHRAFGTTYLDYIGGE